MNISYELAHILEESEVNYMLDRMTAIKQREGNPEGIDIRRFGSCTAFYSRTMPWGLFNNVKGSIEEDSITDLIDYYNKRGRNFEFQIIPSKVNPAVMRLLHEKGFYQSDFHTTMYGEARSIAENNHQDIYIRELNRDEFDLYAEIHCLGTGLSLDGKSYVAANNIILYDRQGWKFYIAYYNDHPAAVAVMYMKDQVASLTFATTLSEYRNKGLQTQLLRRRIHDAHMNNCSTVVGQCRYCSTSHRNMERVGMKIGYTRATWVTYIKKES